MANAWEKAVKEYRNSGGGNQQNSASSGTSAWQKAVDEYKQYGRDAYRSMGQQRTSQRKEQERQFEFENTFKNEANDFFAAARRDLTVGNGFNAADFFEERKQQADALKKKAETIALYLNDHMDSYAPESYDSNIQYLSQFNTQVDDILAQYQPSIDARTGMRAYEDELRAAMERNDQMRANQQSALFAFDPSQPTGFFDKLQQYTDDQSYRTVTDKWTDKERYELGRLQMEDPAKAAEFAANVNSYHNALATEPERQKIREQAAQNLWKNTGKALLTSTFSAQDQFMDRMAEYAARGRTTEKDYVTPWDYAQETTGAISQKLNENAIGSDRYNEISGVMQEGLKGNGVDPFYRNQDAMQTANDLFEGRGIGDLYNLGYSMAQNTLSRYSFGAIPGVGEAATLANYFASAATSGIDEARRMGADGDQAVASGIAKGTWEVATEVLGLDNLYKMGPAITWGDLFKQLGIQGLFEAFGEGANSALGYLSDYYILGDLSEYAQSVQNYIEQGETEETARRKAFLDAAKNVGFEALSGAVSGWVSGGIETGYKTGLENQYYRNVNPQALIDLGMTAGEDTDAFKLAQQMQGQIAEGQKPSGNDKRVLAYNIDLMNLAAQKVDADMAAANMTAEQIEEMKPTTSDSGNARLISKNMPVDVQEFAEVKDGKATVKLKEGTAEYQDISFGTEKQGNQYFAVESLPLLDTAHANKLLHTIQEADAGKDTMEVMAIREAYRLGYMGATTQELRGSDANVLPTNLQDQIYSIAQEQRTVNDSVRATVKAVPTKATGKYKKVVIEGKLSKLNGKRKAEIAYMDRVADEFAGTAVHVYESYKKNGKMYYRDNSGKEQLAPNGKYVNGEIWVDLNSGDKGEGLVLNTFAHEMYHHIEEQNKPKARELAEFVVKELGLETVDKAVQKQIDKARAAGYGEKYFQDKQGMTAEQARNEVYMRAMSDFVADSLETMFTRGDPAKAIANLKKENQGLFDQIKAFIDEWISKVKKFYSDKTISQEGAAVAQLKNFEQLQQMFMEAMQGAGENYQAAESEATQSEQTDQNTDGDERYSIRNDVVDVNGVDYDRVVELDYKVFNKIRRSGKAYIDFIRNNLIKQKITVFDDNGDSEVIEFAGEKERVKKDGSSRDRPVIGELTQARNETKKLVIVNSVETAEISRMAGTSNEHSHQWLDENGWEERTSYVMTKDGTIYPVTLHVAKARDGRNILYDVNVKINEGIAADKIATSQRAKKQAEQAVRTTKPSANTLTQPDSTVNTEMNSLRNQKPPTVREILSQIDISTRKKNEAHFLGQYQENLSNLAEQEPRLAELNAQIKELYKDQKGNLKEITRLQKEQRQVNADVNRLKRLVNAFERSDMGKRLVSEYKLKEQKRQTKETRKDFKAEQKELIQTMQAEQRAIREELTGKISDVTLMEREFIRLAKKYEQLDTRTGKSSIKDAKTIAQLRADLKAEAKSHKEDSKIWEREFNRLLTDYETAGRQIARLEATIARHRSDAKAKITQVRETQEVQKQRKHGLLRFERW